MGVKITAQGTALAVQKTYLEALLKPGRKVVEAVTVTLAKVTKTMSEAEVFRKSVVGLLSGIIKAIDKIIAGLSIFKVTEAIGQFSASELADGKLPRLVSLEVEIAIPDIPPIKVSLSDVQFDFKNAKSSAADIAKKLMTGIKVEKLTGIPKMV